MASSMVQESLATTIQLLVYYWIKAATSCQRMLPGPFRASLFPSCCLLLCPYLTLRLTHFRSVCCAASSSRATLSQLNFCGIVTVECVAGWIVFRSTLHPPPPTPPPLASAASLHPHESPEEARLNSPSPPTSSSFNILFCSATVQEESSL
jgi:hypothetical protein